jgi:hypothetical protein
MFIILTVIIIDQIPGRGMAALSTAVKKEE